MANQSDDKAAQLEMSNSSSLEKELGLSEFKMTVSDDESDDDDQIHFFDWLEKKWTSEIVEWREQE